MPSIEHAADLKAELLVPREQPITEAGESEIAKDKKYAYSCEHDSAVIRAINE